MSVFYCDASALVKRYVDEKGSDIVNRLFESPFREHLTVLIWAVSETAAVLNRRKNAGTISEKDFRIVTGQLIAETDLFHQPKADTEDVRQSIALIYKHNINATDALYLHVALKLHRLLSLIGSQVVLVAADERLLRAAEAEGLSVLNPETASLDELQALYQS